MNDKNKNRDHVVREVVDQIEKAHGKGAIMRLGSEAGSCPVPVIPSGALAIDQALGVGGYPRGRIIEVYGPESSGKTTLSLHAIAEVQKLGGVAAFIDAEHAFDMRYAKAIGIDLGKLLVSQPDSGEQALDIAEALTRSGAVDLVVIDSVAALTPRAEIQGDMGDAHMYPSRGPRPAQRARIRVVQQHVEGRAASHGRGVEPAPSRARAERPDTRDFRASPWDSRRHAQVVALATGRRTEVVERSRSHEASSADRDSAGARLGDARAKRGDAGVGARGSDGA